MRILFVTETLPFPLNSGGRIRTYHTLRMLAPQHEVHCRAMTRLATNGNITALTQLCRSFIAHYVTPGVAHELAAAGRAIVARVPFTLARHFNRAFAERIREDAGHIAPDLIYCDHLSMLQYGLGLDRPVLCDTHNVEFQVVQRYAATLGHSPYRPLAAIEFRALKRYERWAYRSADLVVSISDVDAGLIARLTGGQANVRVVPAAIDASAIAPVSPLTRDPRLLFVGGLHWPPNVDAVDFLSSRILPLVRREMPDAELVVVGRPDVAAVRRLERRPGLTFVGAVDDVRTWYERSRVVVVPLRAAAGVRVKILEAFAHGVPVVSTAVGHEGLAVEPATHLLAADDPEHFAAATVAILRDDRLATRLALAARQFVIARHDVPVVAPMVEAALQQVVHGASPQGRRRAEH